MADVKPVACCASLASQEERCVSCQSSCSCADGPCHCSVASSRDVIAARACAGNDAINRKEGGAICACPQQCPCRSAGCATTSGGVGLNLCAGGEKGSVCCTMPGNCGCNKGCIGKL